VVSIAFVVPLQGPTGIYGPSCLACGQLAVEQLNARNGIAGRRIELVQVDAGRTPEVVAEDVGWLVDTGQVDAVAGWHISAVRVALTRRIGGRVVYDRDAYLKLPLARRALPITGGSGVGCCLGAW